MKSFLFSLFVASCVIIPSTVFAHPEKGEHHAHRGEMMKKELGLSDEQAGLVRDIFKSTRGRCFEKTDPAERKACRESSREERQKQLAQVLTPEQMEKLKALKEQKREQRKEWRKNKRDACEKAKQEA